MVTPRTTGSSGSSETKSPAAPCRSAAPGPSAVPMRRITEPACRIATSLPSSVGLASSSTFARACSIRAPPSAPQMSEFARATLDRRGEAQLEVALVLLGGMRARRDAEPAIPGDVLGGERVGVADDQVRDPADRFGRCRAPPSAPMTKRAAPVGATGQPRTRSRSTSPSATITARSRVQTNNLRRAGTEVRCGLPSLVRTRSGSEGLRRRRTLSAPRRRSPVPSSVVSPDCTSRVADARLRRGAQRSSIRRISASSRRRDARVSTSRSLVFAESTHTAAEAARAVDAEIGQIVKSLVFVAPRRRRLETVVALVSGANRVDIARLAAVVGLPGLRRATADEASEQTGFVIGGIPPFGHRRPLRVVMDPDLGRFDRRLGRGRNTERGLPRRAGHAPDARRTRRSRRWPRSRAAARRRSRSATRSKRAATRRTPAPVERRRQARAGCRRRDRLPRAIRAGPPDRTDGAAPSSTRAAWRRGTAGPAAAVERRSSR